MAKGIDLVKLRTTFLQCGICTYYYDEEDRHPRIFPCLHGSCYTCVRNMVKDNNFKCPNCRKEYYVPNNNVDIFLKDLTRRDLLDFVQIHDSSVVVCDNCSDDTKTKKHASYRCRICAHFLCNDCATVHQKVKSFRDHGLIKLEDLKNKSIDFDDFSLEGQCQVDGHDFAKLTLYCDDCETPICITCALCKHQIHEIRDIGEVFQAKKQNLIDQLESLKKVTIGHHSIIKEIEDDFRHLFKDVKITEESIDKTMANCKDIIENRRKEHNASLTKTRDDKYKLMQQQQKDLQDSIEEIDESCEFARQALQFRNPSAFLLLEKTISDRLHELQNQPYEAELKVNSHISFDSRHIEERMHGFAKTLGSVHYTSAFIPKTVVTVPPYLYLPGSANIIVQLYDYDSNPVSEDNAEVEVKINKENERKESIKIIAKRFELNDNDISPSSYENKRQGYKVKFQPTCKGKYDITISVCGQKIPNVYHISVDEQICSEHKKRQIFKTDTPELDMSYVKERIFTCVVCKSELDTQKHASLILPCLHKIGKSCLHEIQEKKETVECVICQESHLIDQEEIYKLPEDWHFRQLHSFMTAQQTDRLVQTYACCGSGKKISHWCKECSTFMCGNCKRAHGQLVSTKFHELLSLNDSTLSLEDLDKFVHPMFCPDHKDQEIQMFCTSCRKELCVLCTLTHNNKQDHQTHTKLINEVFVEKEKSTKFNILLLKTRLQKIKNAMLLLDQETKLTEKNVTLAKHEMNTEFEKIRSIIQERENYLENALKEIRRNKIHAITEQKRILEEEQSRVLETLYSSELALKYRNKPAFLKMEPMINCRIKKLCLNKVNELPDTLSDVTFIAQNETMEVYSDIGQVSYSTTDLKRIEIVISSPEKVEVDKEIQVFVNLLDSQGDFAKGYIDGWVLKVCDPNGDFSDIIAKYSTNHYQLLAVWKPKIRGVHLLSVHFGTRDYKNADQSISCNVKDNCKAESSNRHEEMNTEEFVKEKSSLKCSEKLGSNPTVDCEGKTFRHIFKNFSSINFDRSEISDYGNLQWYIVIEDVFGVLNFGLFCKLDSKRKRYKIQIKMEIIPVDGKTESLSKTLIHTFNAVDRIKQFKFFSLKDFNGTLKRFIKDDAMTIEVCITYLKA